MRTLPIVIAAGLSSCVSISDEELAERQQAFVFSVAVVEASPAEAMSCTDPGLTLALAVDDTMAGVIVQPTVTLTGGVEVVLPDVEVPASGELVLVDDRPLSCAEGRCDVEVTITLTTPEGASASATTQVARLAAPSPIVARHGVIRDGDDGLELVEGVDFSSSLAAEGGVLDVGTYPVVYAVVEDPVFAEVEDDALGAFEMRVCPDGVPAGSPDCIVVSPVGPQVVVGLVRPEQRAVAIETAALGLEMCDTEGDFRFFVAFRDDLCGTEGVVPILEPMRLGGDCDDDGYTGAADCDDTDGSIYEGAEERCNGLDDDCDGLVPEEELDGDGDDYVGCVTWDGQGTAPLLGDCDDELAEVNPAATEVCNGLDDNCVDGIDEGLLIAAWADLDGDGLGDGDSTMVEVCELGSGLADNADDCDDGNASAMQPVPENHCPDGDVDGFGTSDALLWELHCPGDQPKGWQPPSQCTDCDDGDPAVGQPVAYCLDRDGDGVGSADPLDLVLSCAVAGEPVGGGTCVDCDDTDGSVTEITWYIDGDGDGLGHASAVAIQCDAPAGEWALNSDDCNDADASVTVFYVDGDGDGYGAGGATCDVGAYGFPNVSNDDDCDDGDASFRPGVWRNGGAYGGGTVQAALGVAGGDPLLEICGELGGGVVALGSPVTRIEGTPGKSALVGDGSESVLVIEANGSLTVADLEIREGGGAQGGGIHHSGAGTLFIDGVTLSDNHVDPTSGQGGGLWSLGSVELVNSAIVGNSAFDGGGAWSDGSIDLSLDSRVEANAATEGGGAVYLGPDAVELTGLGALRGNDAKRGGGIYASGVHTIGPLRLISNSADLGGQLFVAGNAVAGASVTVDGGVWSGGMADLGAGAFVDVVAEDLVLDGVTLTGHVAGAEGGAVFTLAPTTIVGGALTGNDALGQPPDLPTVTLPEVGKDVAIVGPSAVLSTTGVISWDADPKGLVTRGSGGGGKPPSPTPQSFDPTTQPVGFSCTEDGCL